jgi:hypothetical protein
MWCAVTVTAIIVSFPGYNFLMTVLFERRFINHIASWLLHGSFKNAWLRYGQLKELELLLRVRTVWNPVDAGDCSLQ